MKDGDIIEIQYSRWVPTTVEQYKVNNRKYRGFPVSIIHKEGEKTTNEVCFINNYMIYDITTDDYYKWRKIDNYDDIESITFTSIDELKEKIETLIPKLFISVLEKNRETFEQLSPEVQMELSNEILTIKNKLVQQIVDYFVKNNSMTPGKTTVMEYEKIQQMCDEMLLLYK